MTDVELFTPQQLSDEWSPEQAAAYILEPWQNAVESIVETSRRLNIAKKRVGHGRWLDTLALMPFSQQSANRLMTISEHPDLANHAHGRDLPPSWRTLATLAQLPHGEVQRRIESGEITPELQRRQAEEMAATYQLAQQETLNEWNRFTDGLTAALAHIQSFNEIPYLPSNYVGFDEVKRRLTNLNQHVNRLENAQ